MVEGDKHISIVCLDFFTAGAIIKKKITQHSARGAFGLREQ